MLSKIDVYMRLIVNIMLNVIIGKTIFYVTGLNNTMTVYKFLYRHILSLLMLNVKNLNICDCIL